MNKISSTESSRLTVTYRRLGDLIPDPRNARTHPKRQIDQIRASIEAFGFTNPVLADPEGNIIAGHGRLQAARAMGLAELPVITLSGLSEAQKRALRIADNKIALNAGWDLEILRLELGEFGSIDVDIDLTLTGFSTGEIDVILTSPVDPDDEVIPQVPATPRTKLGDIWILGDHRVGCGDGRDAEYDGVTAPKDVAKTLHRIVQVLGLGKIDVLIEQFAAKHAREGTKSVEMVNHLQYPSDWSSIRTSTNVRSANFGRQTKAGN